MTDTGDAIERTGSPGAERHPDDGGGVVAVDPELSSIGTRYQRLKLLVPLVILVLSVLGGATLRALLVAAVPTVVYSLFVVLLSVLAIWEMGGGFALATEKPPDRVRAEFLDHRSPFVALTTGVADEVRATDDGVEMTLSLLWRSWQVSYHPRLRDDGTVEAELRTDGEHVNTITATITEDSGHTEVRVESDRSRPTSVWNLLVERLKTRSLVDCWRVQGYDLAADDRSVGLRTP